MNLLLINLIFLIGTAVAGDIKPLEDNVLMAFDRCRSLSVNLQKGEMQVSESPAFDMHCISKGNSSTEFKCDYIDVKTNKRTQLEVLSGGKSDQDVSLSSIGGTKVKFRLGRQNAYFETPLTDNESIQGRRICAGIFLMEKEALKKKK